MLALRRNDVDQQTRRSLTDIEEVEACESRSIAPKGNSFFRALWHMQCKVPNDQLELSCRFIVPIAYCITDPAPLRTNLRSSGGR